MSNVTIDEYVVLIIDQDDKESFFNYHEFLMGLPEYTRINSFRNIYDKSSKNLNNTNLLKWYESKGSKLVGSKVKTITLKKKVWSNDLSNYHLKRKLISEKNVFEIIY